MFDWVRMVNVSGMVVVSNLVRTFWLASKECSVSILTAEYTKLYVKIHVSVSWMLVNHSG